MPDATTNKARAKKTGHCDSISSAPISRTRRTLEETIGRQIRLTRQRQALTAKTLAKRSGISIALLSRVEHGTVSPSLHTLELIAQGLGVPFNHLFMQVTEKRGAAHVTAGNGIEVVRSGSIDGQIYQLLGIPMDSEIQVEPYLIKVDKNSKTGQSFQHEGVELLYVLEGGLVYRHGEKNYRLSKGDSLFFDARVSHGPEEFLKLPTQFLSIISYRRH